MFTYDEESQQRAFLLTSEFEELLSHEILQESFTSMLLKYTDGAGTEHEKSGIITIDGTELYSLSQGEDVVYFDEDFIITSYEEHNSITEYDPDNYYTVDYKYKIKNTKNGSVIIEGASFVSTNLEYDYTKLSGNILAYKDGILNVINRNEGIKAGKEIPGFFYANMFRDDVFFVSIDIGEYEYSNTVLDESLNEVVPKGIYYNIRQGMRWTGNEYEFFDVLIGESHGERSMSWFSDLLDFEGNTLISGLNSVFEVGPDRISVRKGFDVGLMDWQGNWIVKRSIFSELQDD
jgi:hypothetical protein